MATVRKQNMRAGMGEAHAGRCRACAHDGHAQALRLYAWNIYAQRQGFVHFVNVDATGNLLVSMQCRYMDMGKSGVPTFCHGAFSVEACCTSCHSVLQKSLSSFSLVSATHTKPLGAARPVASACGPANVHRSKAPVSGPAPGTSSPRSCQGEPSALSHCARAISISFYRSSKLDLSLPASDMSRVICTALPTLESLLLRVLCLNQTSKTTLNYALSQWPMTERCSEGPYRTKTRH